LQFAAKLRLSGTLESKMDRVEEIISQLRLNKCADTKIGGSLIRGVSGGERKRTSIGVELVTDPNLIFLDEPTTGLDSFTATSVIELLSELSKQGRTVISTIHQPNSDIFNSFDQLMLMAKGKIIYMVLSHYKVIRMMQADQLSTFQRMDIHAQILPIPLTFSCP
jgi:ABC-type multidrug transport system ATPase subunit